MDNTQKNDEAIKVTESLRTNCKKEWNKPKVNNLSEINETESGIGGLSDGTTTAASSS